MESEDLEDIAWIRALAKAGRLGDVRAALDLSLSEVARALAVNPATVGRWESGLRKPRAENCLRYAAVLRTLKGGSHE